MATTEWTQEAGMTGDIDSDNVQDLVDQAEDSKDAAAASQTAAAASATAAATSAANAASSAVDANSSASDAATSETNAATSATSAASSATSSASSASAASTSASNAATSATNAAASETAAGTSETNAATSATNAASSASDALTQAGNAATSASAASSSATAAASSASAASASETAAAASETAAAASETAASNSETNAANSETNAATSATNAATSETNAATSASSASTSATAASNAQTAAEAAQAAAEAAQEAIDGTYLGALASDPTVDGNGDAVTTGDWYFNTTDSQAYIYNGSSWDALAPDLVGDTTPQLGGNLDTNNYNITFGDNDKAIFGTNSNLEIYFDGTNSIIADVGTGDLNIRGGNDIRIQNGDGSETFAVFNESSSVELRYAGDATKLATTSTGIDVTGTVTADGLTVDGTTSTIYVDVDTSGADTDIFKITTDVGAVYRVRTDSSLASPDWKIQTGGSEDILMYPGGVQAARFEGSGDISFYEDTGTTAKFFWDASAESLGIGTSSPSYKLHVLSSGNGVNSRFTNGSTIVDVIPTASTSFVGDSGGNNAIGFNTASNYVALYTNATSERMRIDSSGNVGIGTSSPSAPLSITATTTTNPLIRAYFTSNDVPDLATYSGTVSHDVGLRIENSNASATYSGISLNTRALGQSTWNIYNKWTGTAAGDLLFVGRNSSNMYERMRIVGSTGNVGIGTSSPAAPIHLKTTGSAELRLEQNGAGYGSIKSSDFGILYLDADAGNTAASTSMRFRVDGTERMRIDSIGRVGIGTDNPTAQLTVNKEIDAGNTTDTLTHRFTSANGSVAYFTSGGTVGGGIVLGDANSTVNYNRIRGEGNALTFDTNGAEAMRIDSNGSLLVGKTTAGLANSGLEVTQVGLTYMTRNNAVLGLNRTSTDGGVQYFYKDGATRAQIGLEGNDSFYIGNTYGSNGGGIHFHANGNVSPMKDGVRTDNHCDLGASGFRWKNLYLSGGVYLGGTGSANYLDDYEEGTWTPAVSATSTNPTVTYTTQSGSYTKIGRTVTLHFRIDYSARSGGTGTFLLTGFPFQTSTAQYYSATGNMMTYGIDYGTGIANLAFEVSSSAYRAYIIETKESNGVWANTSIEDFNTGNTYLRGTITYVTDS